MRETQLLGVLHGRQVDVGGLEELPEELGLMDAATLP